MENYCIIVIIIAAMIFGTITQPTQHINVNEENRIRYVNDKNTSNFFIRNRENASNF